jgi:hypothetical protein
MVWLGSMGVGRMGLPLWGFFVTSQLGFKRSFDLGDILLRENVLQNCLDG